MVHSGIGVAQLFANLADVHINTAVERRKLAAENDVHQALARNYPACFTQQYVQKIELYGCEFDWLPFLQNCPRSRIEFDFTDVKRLSCTELVHRATRALAPFLGVVPSAQRILFLRGTGITPDAWVSSPLELVWASASVRRGPRGCSPR